MTILSRTKDFFISNKLFLLVAITLFFLPFFWLSDSRINLGGDSNRLYFYDPSSYLKNTALFSPNNNDSLGKDNPTFFILPYLAQLILIKKIFYNSGFILNNINNGIILAGGFISVYLVLLELLPRRKKKDINAQLTGLAASLFLVLSPILIYDRDRALYAINQILVYPLIFFSFSDLLIKKIPILSLGYYNKHYFFS